ncbi:MAG: cytochrome b/b6 domain-containing protein, partial [Bacteroidales bacterium]|nr:cytochrome b/b6 domain-containing protein [Bacteroidales bacterium]
PVMVLSGLAYMFYRYPQAGIIQSANMQDLEVIAIIHTFGAFVLVAFIITHLYLITTGHTVTSNLKAMVTGWEELEADENEPFTENEPIIETEPKI